jgi:hypothetical protein
MLGTAMLVQSTQQEVKHKQFFLTPNPEIM